MAELSRTSRSLTGWGRATSSVSEVVAAGSVAELADLVRRAGPRGVLARGLGRSYGDAAQNGGGRVLSPYRPGQEIELDPETGLVRMSAGTSIARALRELLPLGRSLPVLPGTGQVSVGGAIAADVHGKNHQVAGAIGPWITSVELVDGDGELRTLTPESEPEQLWATVGGMGLTGIMTAATIRTVAVPSGQLAVRTRRLRDLDALLDAMRSSTATYQVAWVDGTRGGFGRAVLDEAEHAAPGPAARRTSPSYPSGGSLAVPTLPVSVVRPGLIQAFNQAWWRHAPTDRRHRTGFRAFFHPLDRVGSWSKLYGPAGLLQWQFVVPDRARHLVAQSLAELVRAKISPALVVVKRLGPADPAPLSFPREGWTVAVDLAAGTPSLANVLERLDDEVVDAGGRVYLAKDARVPGPLLARMYPELDSWRSVRAGLDPRGVFVSDLSRRLGLT